MEFEITSVIILVSICLLPISMKIKSKGWRQILLTVVACVDIVAYIIYDNVSMIYLAVMALLLMIYTWTKRTEKDETDGNNSQL